ncbi:MAG: dephospho-CoA kinase [Bacteroidia bacterium]|nr:dephospho-CoA kinase [Bacteroidia bacterium]
MLKVGITGGIGSGKSIVCRIFKLLGIPVYDADTAAKELMNRHPEIRQKILETFGHDSYTAEGLLRRAYLSKIVFSNPQALEKLNHIVHPYVREDYLKWQEHQTESPYTLHEAAILFESGAHKDMDAIVLVDAPEELRIRRVIERDGRNRQDVKSIISRQWTTEKKQKLSDYIIQNDEQQMLIPQVLKTDQLLRNRA